MRVIAGKARRINLCTVPGLETRPTTDRTKETLFNVLNPYLYDANFLDLYSGSGAIGIEALSRGARQAVFVEKNPAAIECIKKNLNNTKLQELAKLLSMDVTTALSNLEKKGETFDLIFMDPPYNHDFEKQVLLKLDQTNLVTEDTIIIVEASLDTKFDYLENTRFEVYRTKEYKTNKHVFIEVN